MKILNAVLTIVLITFFVGANNCNAQDNSKNKITILPMPYSISGEDIRTVIQKYPVVRVALNKVKEFLIKNGYTAIDFEARLKKSELDGSFRGIDNSQTIKSIFIDNSNADIYLEIDINFKKSSSGNSVNLLINAYRTATSTVFASFDCNSQKFHTEDVGHLVKRALLNCEENFQAAMQRGIEDLKQNGESLQFQINIDDQSQYNLYSIFSDSQLFMETAPLKDLIEFWFSESGYINYYNDISSGERFLKIQELRINQQDDDGNEISPSKVFFKLRTYLTKLHPEQDGFPLLKIEEDKINGTRYLRIK